MMVVALSGCGQNQNQVLQPQSGTNAFAVLGPPPTADSNIPLSITPSTAKASSTKNRALIYQGPGACEDGCTAAAYEMALRNGFVPTYVGPTALDPKSTDADRAQLFQNVAIWIQPGGKSSDVLQAMTLEMVSALQGFVKNGGGYVGFCAGAFSSTNLVGTTTIPGYNIFPGKTILYVNPNNADILDVTWEGKLRHLYWEGGPYITELPAGQATPIAYYPSGQIAAARSSYGTGKVFITGLHPEAPQFWRDYYGLTDSDGLDYDLADEMISWVTH